MWYLGDCHDYDDKYGNGRNECESRIYTPRAVSLPCVLSSAGQTLSPYLCSLSLSEADSGLLPRAWKQREVS